MSSYETQFSRRYRVRTPKAVERLHHDWERLGHLLSVPEGALVSSAHQLMW